MKINRIVVTLETEIGDRRPHATVIECNQGIWHNNAPVYPRVWQILYKAKESLDDEISKLQRGENVGTDIHIGIQVYEDETWRGVPYQTVWQGREPRFPDRPVAPEQFEARNYNLFAILANVRNGRGFAGIQTGEGWPSIAANRGLPPDYTEPVGGEYGLTWVMLDELKKFEWDLIRTKLYGVIPAGEFEKLGVGNRPESFAGDVSGRGILVYTPGEYEFAKRHRNLVENPYVRTSWTSTAREATYDWPGKVLPWLEELAAGRPLRLVISFDS